MKTVTLFAPAKLNLTLDVLGLREDGYHELDMLMQTVSLCDEITITIGTGEGWSISCTGPDGAPIPDVPCDARNLAWRAAERFCRAARLDPKGISIAVRKQIPSMAGMAGGSADAAAVLRGLNACFGSRFSEDELCRLGAQCGSDVPFCVMGKTARVQGRGEIVQPIPLDTVQHYVICKPDFGISTPALFSLCDRYPALRHPDAEAMVEALRENDCARTGALLCNVLEEAALRIHPNLEQIRRKLLDAGACGARMTGSGSAVFGLFAEEAAAKQAEALLRQEDFSVFYAHSV